MTAASRVTAIRRRQARQEQHPSDQRQVQKSLGAELHHRDQVHERQEKSPSQANPAPATAEFRRNAMTTAAGRASARHQTGQDAGEVNGWPVFMKP